MSLRSKILRLFNSTVMLGVTLCIFNIHVLAESQLAREYDLKAAFLFNFMRFIQIPDRVYQSNEGNILLCIDIASDYFEPFSVIEDRSVQSKSVKIVSIDNIEEAKACALVFRTKLGKIDYIMLLQELRGRGIVTVGEQSGFCQEGGIINFYFEGNKMRFEINYRAAQAEDIRISSKLLRLARIVE